AVGVAAFHEASAHWAVEVAVAPERRSSQVEKEAILAAAGLVPDSDVHTIWAFRPAQLKAAGLIGYREIRAVLRMAGPIPQETGGRAQRIATATLDSAEVADIIAVNNRAFAEHREQGALSEASFASLANQPWFAPAGVLVSREGERVTGFCITKYDGDQRGEIFLIGVDPPIQHTGIGRDLIEAGFGVLRSRGVQTVHVWVDEANEAAVRFYTSLGLAEDFRTSELALP
ncbi:MAG: GNAT family N-acetyltransferase, partial [Actinomycetota bacterium]|nr:GNAT family N-acetyltransferase [Actinomycetota bacterium]